MPVNAISNQNLKTRFTRKGNSYQKTNLAKVICTGIGAGSASAALIKNNKQISDAIYNAASSTLKNGKQIEGVAKMAKIGTAAGAIGACALAGLAAGAVVDAVVNKVRAHKADKTNA